MELGAENRITIVVSNILNWQSIPPGRVDETPDGPRQRTFHDFYNYAGLHRTVWLYARPAAHISDITVVTDLNGPTGVVRYQVATAGAQGATVHVALHDAAGAEVARAEGSSGELTVERVHAWRPGDGYLYELASSYARPTARSTTPTHCRSACARCGSTASASRSTASRSTSVASASTRTAPCAAKATTIPSWCMTSR